MAYLMRVDNAAILQACKDLEPLLELVCKTYVISVQQLEDVRDHFVSTKQRRPITLNCEATGTSILIAQVGEK